MILSTHSSLHLNLVRFYLLFFKDCCLIVFISTYAFSMWFLLDMLVLQFIIFIPTGYWEHEYALLPTTSVSRIGALRSLYLIYARCLWVNDLKRLHVLVKHPVVRQIDPHPGSEASAVVLNCASSPSAFSVSAT